MKRKGISTMASRTMKRTFHRLSPVSTLEVICLTAQYQRPGARDATIAPRRSRRVRCIWFVRPRVCHTVSNGECNAKPQRKPIHKQVKLDKQRRATSSSVASQSPQTHRLHNSPSYPEHKKVMDMN